MATLVLSTVGRFLGGAIGSAIGATVGNVLDRDVLFKPADREGPRLTALQLQTSSYGTPLQRIFGTMRIGGCVIWSTDLIESKSTSGGGKGQPSTTNYSYSASFAVALSGRAIVGVGRIWADGKLLRGAGGDFKSETGFRLHLGDEDQPVDPLIAAAEGAGQSPAHRGIAYAVFEHMQLADYGNRIPSLTFEVIGDAAPVGVGTIAEALSDGVIEGAGATLPLAGFAAYGDSVRSVVELLAVAGAARFAPDGALLHMRSGIVPEREVADDETMVAGSARAKHGRAVAALEAVPRLVTLAHYDPARDYQTGLQRARRPGAGNREDRVEMPAAIDAGTAKTMAETVLSRAEAGRERRTVSLGWSALGVTPGACVTIRDAPGVWRVTDWALEHMVLSLECVRLAAGTLPLAGSAGRVLPAPDVATGTTILTAFEGLPLDDTALAAPRVTVVAAGTAPGWRRAAVLYSLDGGMRWIAAAIGGQAAGDRFVLIEADSALSLDLPLAAVGTEVRIMASGPGDNSGPTETTMLLRGTSIVPPAPVQLRWSEIGNGDATVIWVRRSRIGWRWIDRVDAPLGEERELYRVVLTSDAGVATEIETMTASLVVPAAARTGAVSLAVRQVGALGESLAAHLSLPAWVS